MTRRATSNKQHHHSNWNRKYQVLPIVALAVGIVCLTDVPIVIFEWLTDNWMHLAAIAVPNLIVILAFLLWNHRKNTAPPVWANAGAIRASDSRDVSAAVGAPNKSAIDATSKSSLSCSSMAQGKGHSDGDGDRGPGALDPNFAPLLAPYDEQSLHHSPHTIYGVWADANLTMGYANTGWFDHAKFNGGTAPYLYHPMGISLLASMPDILRPFFADNFRRVIREQRPWEHVYECSSPDRYRLLHMMVFPLQRDTTSVPLPLRDGLLVVHSLRVERPHDRLPLPPLDHLYRDPHGLLQQCVHCRRVLRQLSVSSPATNNNNNTNTKANAGNGVDQNASGPGASETKRSSHGVNVAIGKPSSSVGAHPYGITPINGTWDWIPAWLHRPQARTTHGTCPTCAQFYYTDQRLQMSSDRQFPASFITGEIMQYPPASLPPSPDVERWASQWRAAATIPHP